MSIFSKNLRYLRREGNYNQDDIALLFQKKANTIGNWENQKSEPSLTELMRLGEFFKVSVEDLLHIDMQKLSGSGEPGAISDKARNGAVNAIPSSEAAGPGHEAGQDAFWFILKELRIISERLDLLTTAMETGGFKKNSDKSYY